MEEKNMGDYNTEYREKMFALIDDIKQDPRLQSVMMEGPLENRVRVLMEYGVSMEDLANFYQDMDQIASKQAICFWRC
jgi:hypothetical protein